MIVNVASYKLPVAEHLLIQKNRITPPAGNPNIGRISIVSGTHGDELEGQYICYEVIRRLNSHPEYLNGTVDIYPALNPLGMDSSTRAIPKLNMDMNRMFPGSMNGTMMDKVAARIVEDIAGSDVCVDVHASDTFVKEMPQVRLSEEYADGLLDFARLLNADLVWINMSMTVHEATLANSLNALSVPAMVVEMGLGNRINRRYGDQITEGIFNLMHEVSIWAGPVSEVRRPRISKDDGIDFFRAQTTGIFLPEVSNGDFLESGAVIGKMVETLTGEVQEIIKAVRPGQLFTLREYPIAYEGALLARVLASEQTAERQEER